MMITNTLLRGLTAGVFLMMGFPAYSQSAKEVEGRILSDLEHINRLRDKPSNKATDSLIVINSKLMKYLAKACKNNPALLKADFKKSAVDEQMNILTSEDGKMRIYNWDAQIGSAATYYSALVQYYVDDSTTGVTIMNDASAEIESGSGEKNTGEWYSKIHMVERKHNYPAYLLIGKSRYTPRSMECFIDAYAIYYGKLNATNVFMNKNQYSSSVSAAYHAADDNPDIRVANDKQHVFIPAVNKMTDFATGKYHIYTFDGNNYVFDKNIN
jgi:hypothetical protein